MARRSSGGRGRGGSWLTACFFPSSSGKERGEAQGAEESRCVYIVTADYQRQENTEISLKGGESVEVIEKSESGEWYLTVQAFSSTSQDELGFQSGVLVEVIQRNLEGWWFIRYGGKEGWAPAAYLRKIQDGVKAGNHPDETNTSPQSQVEIIGNLMEISNLLNKKPSHEQYCTQMDTHSQTDTYAQYSEAEKTENHSNRTSTNTMENTRRDSEDQHTHSADSSEISVSLSLPSGSVFDVCESSTPPSIISSKIKTVPPSPAIARVAPQRFHSVETKSPSNNQKPPPRRENSLGFQLPHPPDPPAVEAEYYTIAEFRSCLTDGISFSGGQRADVIEKNSGGWWYVQIGEKEGWAPCSYIDKRKKPTLNRQASTLTRPKVPPPAPPIKKQNSLPSVESGGVTPTSPPVYEEPEYDVPAVGLEFDPDLDFFSCDSPTKASPEFGQRIISFTLGEGDEEDDEGVYANGDFRFLPKFRDNNSEIYSSSAHQTSIWDPPEYDAPTIEPIFESNTALYAQSRKSEESKSKPSVKPKPTNQDFNSLRRPVNQEQPSQMQIQFKTSPTSNESVNASCNDIQSSLTDSSSVMYCTTAAYQREEPCELSFPAGVQVEVLEKQESGWWFVRWRNEEGWAPTFYLQPIKSFETNARMIKTTEKATTEPPSPELDISVQVEVGKVSKSTSLEKNEQRVNQSLRDGQLTNAQNYRVGVKQLAVRPQNVLKENTGTQAATVRQRKDTLPRHSMPQSYNEQNLSSYADNTGSIRRKVPVSMVKPKPHLIHNNLREEYVSIADYRGDSETMSFPAGTRLEVLERNPNGWWYCRILDTSKTCKGWVPSNFLERKS